MKNKIIGIIVLLAVAGVLSLSIAYIMPKKSPKADIQTTGIIEASERIKSAEKSLQEAKEQLEIMDARQAEGLSFPIEVADAKYSVAYAGGSHAIAVSDYMIAQAKYDRAVGVIKEGHAR